MKKLLKVLENVLKKCFELLKQLASSNFCYGMLFGMWLALVSVFYQTNFVMFGIVLFVGILFFASYFLEIMICKHNEKGES